MSEIPLTTDFDTSTAVLNAFYEQERSLDEMEEELSPTSEEIDSTIPPYPSDWIEPAARATPSFYPPQLPLSPLTNLAPSPSEPTQPSRTQKRNLKRRERCAAREREPCAKLKPHWKDNHRMKKVALSLSHPISVDFPLSAYPISKDDGLTGRPRNLQRGDRAVRSVDYFCQKGFRVVEWDGVFVLLVVFIPRR